MNRVSAKTDRGNQVPKDGRLSRCRPSDAPLLLESSEAGVLKLMAAPSATRALPVGSDAPSFA